MVKLGERDLSQVIRQSLTHYHTERHHQGLGNVRLAGIAGEIMSRLRKDGQ
jgi:hypothetical protein